MLRCIKCKEEKPADIINFPPHNKKRNGLDSWCRICRASYRNEIARGRFRSVAPDNLIRELRAVMECTICGDLPTNGKCHSIDHDHKTGQIRGVLCSSCNLGLGKFKDDPQLLEFARIYLLSSVDHPEADVYLGAA